MNMKPDPGRCDCNHRLRFFQQIVFRTLYLQYLLSYSPTHLNERGLIIAAQCLRSKKLNYQPIHDLLFWSVPESNAMLRAFKIYIHILVKDWNGKSIEKIDHKEAILDIKSAMKDRKI